MDDIQFWLYLAFGAVYFLSRMFKKKKAKNAPKTPTQQAAKPANRPKPAGQKPLTFEELLREFTQEEEEDTERAPEPVEVVPERKPEPKRQDFQKEGQTRAFADEESRRVYQESIERAEGFNLEFERDEHFKSKIQRQEEEEDSLAEDVRDGLADGDEARKAVIYAEIFNRRY